MSLRHRVLTSVAACQVMSHLLVRGARCIACCPSRCRYASLGGSSRCSCCRVPCLPVYPSHVLVHHLLAPAASSLIFLWQRLSLRLSYREWSTPADLLHLSSSLCGGAKAISRRAASLLLWSSAWSCTSVGAVGRSPAICCAAYLSASELLLSCCQRLSLTTHPTSIFSVGDHQGL